ncbi:uncharacterized protein IWZ02DRAFT_98207 [Phyllosticta citriasiana]|uniref:uncharacterized protein n=1 Tax=Phyllosticta citriasiana TaxID=595635 RepID=UPI0030FD5412
MSMAYDLMSCKGIFSKQDAEMDGAFTEVLEGLSFHCWVPRSVEIPHSLPSWVPDFRRIWCAPVKRVLNEQWTACTSIPAQIRNLPQKGRVGLGGFRVDEGEAVAPRLNHPACWHGNFYYRLSRSNCQCPAKWKNTLPLWLQFASSLNSSYPTGEPFLKVLWHILLGEDDGVAKVESEAQNKRGEETSGQPTDWMPKSSQCSFSACRAKGSTTPPMPPVLPPPRLTRNLSRIRPQNPFPSSKST